MNKKLAILLLIFIGAAATAKSENTIAEVITPETYPGIWPYKVNKITLICNKDLAYIETSDSKTYALNGLTSSYLKIPVTTDIRKSENPKMKYPKLSDSSLLQKCLDRNK